MTLTRQQVAAAAEIASNWIRHQAALRGVPSVSYAFGWQGDTVLAGSRGLADIAAGAAATADTGYRVASITKTFTATLVMQLVEDGKLRLDEPVTSYLSWLRPALRADITVRHLLTHSAGMIADGSCAWNGDDFPSRDVLHEEVLAGAVVADPSSGFRYSNVAYALLGEIVETVTGRRFGLSLDRRIARPLGLEASGTRSTPHLRKTLAVGYWRTLPGEEPRPAAAADAGAFEPAGGLISNVGDLLRYQTGHFPGDTRILSELSKREMQRAQWLRSEEPHHGYGWMIWTVDGVIVRGHTGGYAGFNTRIGFSPELRLAAAVLTNTIGPLPVLAVDVFFHAVARVCERWGDATASGGSRRLLGTLAGRYRGNWGELHAARVNGALYLVDPEETRPLDLAARLAPVDDAARFVIAEHDDYGYRGEQVSFERDASGRGSLLWYGPYRMARVPDEG